MRRPVLSFRPWQRLATLSAVGLALGCASPETDLGDREPDGALRGEVVSYLLDFADHSETQYLLRLPNGEERKLILDGEHDLSAGTRVRLWGTELADGIKVTRVEHETQPTVEAVRSALINGKMKPPRRWAFVLVDTGAGVNLTKETATTRLFDPANPKSMKAYYKEISFGQQDLDGEVFGPIKFQPGSGCDSSGVARTLRPMITGTFDQYLWYFGSRQQCDWAGLAALGTADRPQRDSWYNASSGCVVLAQEPGHNFGMVHSSSLACTSGGARVPLALPGQGTCTHSEYGNSFDPMGGGNTCYHMDGFQKAYQDWLTGCNVVKVTSSGTFTIFPLEKACNGVQLLQIPFGGARTFMLTNGPTSSISNYYLELRAPIGVDMALTPRVFVTIGGNIAEARGRGGRNWLLDMTSATTTKVDAALPVGMMYSDPDPMGPKFTVISADATKAVIKVVAAGGETPETDAPGKGICDDMTAFTAPGPDTCDAPPVSSPAVDGGASMPVPDAKPFTPPDATGGGTGGSTGGGTGGAGGSPRLDAGALPSVPKDAAPTMMPPSEEEDAGDTTGPTGKPVRGSCGCHLGGRADTNGVLLLSGVFAAAFVLARRRRRR